MKTFFSLNRSNGESKSPPFRTNLKNVHKALVKSALKNSFSQKTILPTGIKFKNLFLRTTFFGCTFE
jgi:hypothetical protein